MFVNCESTQYDIEEIEGHHSGDFSVATTWRSVPLKKEINQGYCVWDIMIISEYTQKCIENREMPEYTFLNENAIK